MTFVDTLENRSFPDVPVTANQEQLLTLMELYPNSTKAYEMISVVSVRGALDRRRLVDAYRSLVKKHKALRTVFVKSVDGWLQKISEDIEAICFLDDPDANERNVIERARKMAESRFWHFDLQSGPLTKLIVVNVNSDEHVLVLYQHHLISDGQSVALLFRYLFKIYAELTDGGFEEPSQAARLVGAEDDAFESQVHYWKAELDGHSGNLDLPTDFARSNTPSFNGATLEFKFDEDTRSSLNTKVAHTGVSTFAILLAAWGLTLSRLTGKESLVVGTPMSNRTSPGILNALGFFANIVPFRMQLRYDLTIDVFLKQVQEAVIRAYENQSAPFYKVVKECVTHRVEAMNPLFQVFFGYNKMVSGTVANSDVSWRQMPYAPQTSQFDLSLVLWEADDGVHAHLNYSTDLFREDTIKEIQEQAISTLRELVSEANVALADIPSVSQSGIMRLSRFNQAGYEDVTHDVLELFEAQVAKEPDATAIVAGRSAVSLSYRQVDERAHKLAAEFSRLGLGEGAIVGLFLGHEPSIIIGMLAAMKLRATYVPLDPKFPIERLKYILEDCAPDVLLVGEDMPDWLRECDCPKITTGTEACWRVSTSPGATRQTGAGPDLAYVLYTSGSTGNPKGVAVGRKAFNNFIQAMLQVFEPTEQDSFLALTTMSFDISGLELLLPLTRGARVVFSDYSETLDVSRLSEVIEAYDVTFIQATPSAWRSIIIGGWKGCRRVTALCGGEPLPLELATQIENHVGELWNMYGPTETTVWSTCYKVKTGDLARSSRVPIGRPIRNTIVEILDRRGKRVPIGATGEIWIGGDGLADGYFRRQDLTNKSFVELNLPCCAAKRFYRTGDIGRWLPDGTLECLGRNDSQVKIRGHRIELGEIEHILTRHRDVAAAAVILKDDEEKLIAFVQPYGGGTIDTADIRKYLARHLPGVMIPKNFVQLEKLPETPNRKVDVKTLRQIYETETQITSRTNFVSATELLVLDCWASVLQNSAIGKDSNFFDIGGHSLHAVRLISMLNKQKHITLNVADIFSYPVFADFVARVEEIQKKPTKTIHLRAASDGVPVVFLHSGEGTINYINNLLQFIPEIHPVLAFDPFQLGSISDSDFSVEALASRYLEALIHERPQGPYIFIGWSAGGTIAIEMANQLASNGNRVASVVLIDTSYSYPEPVMDYSGGPGDLSHVGLVRWLSRDLPIPARFQLLNHARSTSLSEFIAHCVSSKLIESLGDAAQLEAVHHMRCKLAFAVAKYKLPSSLGCKVFVFNAQDELGDDWTNGWQDAFASEPEVKVLPGTHFSIVEDPNVRLLGRHLGEILIHAD